MSDTTRDYWGGILETEFLELQKRYDVVPDPKTLRPRKRFRLENISFTFPSEVSKGIAVRLALTTMLWWIDRRRSPKKRATTWVIMVDGTGAYKNQVEKIFEGLRSSDVVIGRRRGDYWGMPDRRKKVELFEKYLLQQAFDIELPDCQAGIWGLRAPVLERLAMTASGYGLEFDLVTGLSQQGIGFQFADVECNPFRAPNTYSVPAEGYKANTAEETEQKNPENLKEAIKKARELDTPELEEGELDKAIHKLKFIRHRLGLSLHQLETLLDEYSEVLPDEYVENVRTLIGLEEV